jgi:hypothetical protein
MREIMRPWLTGARVLAALLGFSLCLPYLTHAATIGELDSLRGLKGVAVALEKINPEIEHLGLNRAQIKTEVEARLARGGVKKITKKDVFTGKPWLYININAFETADKRLIVYAISVELLQDVRLVREPLVSTAAVTWSISDAGYTDSSHPDNILKIVDRLVDRFIRDYAEANRDYPESSK